MGTDEKDWKARIVVHGHKHSVKLSLSHSTTSYSRRKTTNLLVGLLSIHEYGHFSRKLTSRFGNCRKADEVWFHGTSEKINVNSQKSIHLLKPLYGISLTVEYWKCCLRASWKTYRRKVLHFRTSTTLQTISEQVIEVFRSELDETFYTESIV